MSKLFNRCLSVFLCLISLLLMIVVTSRPLKAATVAFAGKGTVEDPYLIRSGEDLEHLAKLITVEDRSYVGSSYALTDDLVLTNEYSWPGISSKRNPFSGVFDGRNHTISKLYIDIEDGQNATYGLFGSNAGVIKNLRLSDVNINVHVPQLEGYRDGEAGIVNIGAVAGFNSETIQDVVVDGELSLIHDTHFDTNSTIGGLVGQNEGDIKQVHNAAVVSFASLSPLKEEAVGNVGGICGINEAAGNINHSSNSGSIRNDSGPSFASTAGGITGRNSGEIDYAANLASVSSFGTDGSAAGIDGYSLGGSITNAYNLGEINGAFAGGIIGAGHEAVLSKSYNAGTVRGTKAQGSLVATAHFFKVTIKESYYLEGSGPALGLDNLFGPNTVNAVSLTAAKLRTGEGMEPFNWIEGWCLPPHGLNEGYPTHRNLLRGELYTEPDKLDYRYGEELDLSGSLIRYQLGYMDERLVPIDSSLVRGYDPYRLGEQVVTVEDYIFKDEFMIRVHDYPLALHLRKAPDKRLYELASPLDLTGAELELEMAGGYISDLELSMEMISGYDAKRLGIQTITIRYENLDASFEIEVFELKSSEEPLESSTGAITVESTNTEATSTETTKVEITNAETTAPETSIIVAATTEVEIKPSSAESTESRHTSTTQLVLEPLPATGHSDSSPIVAWPLILAGFAALIWIGLMRHKYF